MRRDERNRLSLMILAVGVLVAALVAGGLWLKNQNLGDKLQKAAWTYLFDGRKILNKTVPAMKTVKDTDTNVFAAVFQENEMEDEEVKIEIDVEKYDTAILEDDKNASILIYHTHASESYTQSGAYTYQPSGNFRTMDNSKNVVHLGDLLTKELKDVHGISVTHDTENYEAPDLNTAYSRSLSMLQRRVKENSNFKVFIDLHRDAYDKPGDVIEADGKRLAKVMFVVGTGEGTGGVPMNPRPDYKANYALAKAVMDKMNADTPGIAKKVLTKTSRYNQHMGSSMLIELGYTGNTMEEVENTIPYLARGIAEAVQNK